MQGSTRAGAPLSLSWTLLRALETAPCLLDGFTGMLGDPLTPPPSGPHLAMLLTLSDPLACRRRRPWSIASRNSLSAPDPEIPPRHPPCSRAAFHYRLSSHWLLSPCEQIGILGVTLDLDSLSHHHTQSILKSP